MTARSAVIFLPNDTARTGSARPMLLQRVMGTPLLAWLSAALAEVGVARCFLVCHSRFLEEARACMCRVIADAKAQGRKGCVLTCKDKLLHYYGKLGFVNEGVSQSTHGGVVWYEMRLTF